MAKKYHSDIIKNDSKIKEINWAYETLMEYIKNYKFTFSKEEITKQFPQEFLKRYKNV